MMMRNHLTSLLLSFIYGSPAAPDPVRLGLESISARWFRGVWISGIVVAVGCMFEIWEVTFDFKNWRRHRKNLLPLPDNPGSWMYPMAALGLFLVVGGIVSETVFEVLVSNSDAAIRSHESDVISNAEVKADVADQKAAAATDRASAVDNQTQGLKTNAEVAKKQAEDEHTARVKVEAEVSFRSLSDQQKKDMGNALAHFKTEVGTSLWFPNGDTEAELFADDITEALRSGGIIVQPPAGIVSMRGTGKFNDPLVRADTGVIVQSTKVGFAPQFADAIIAELNKRGFDARRQTDPPFDNRATPEVWINVEARPKGPQGEYKLQAKTKSSVALSR
jgi:hypothetical protein